jgi:L-ascorbate metabolism protein UlaG (beta-lactamase superfamily)
LVSHTHPDHYDVDGIGRIPGSPTVIVPWRRGSELKMKGLAVVRLKPGEVHEAAGVKVTAVRARHTWGNCLGYLVEMDGTKIYYSGDTRLFKELGGLGREKIDVMLLPYGGASLFGTIWTTGEAVRAVKTVGPRICVPIHWGTFDRWWTSRQPEPPGVFLEKLRKDCPEVQGRLVEAGQSLSVDRIGGDP